MDSTLYSQVKSVMNTGGIPDYIWEPIMKAESGGDPSALAITSREYSVGLFQINRKAHPEYSLTDLQDPVKNAEIALKDFIAPAWSKVQFEPDQVAQTVSVYKNGIRPKWTTATEARIKDYTYDFIKNGVVFTDTDSKGKVIYSSPIGPGLTDLGAGSTIGQLTFFQSVGKIIMIVILIVFILFIVLKLFDVNAGKLISMANPEIAAASKVAGAVGGNK